MEKFHLDYFKNKDFDFEFFGCDVYSDNNLNFLINRTNGSTLLIKNDILDALKNLNTKDLNENLKIKLIQRGFANYKNTNLDYTKFETEYKPKHFCIELTQYCNLRCKYCFINFENLNKDSISESMIKKICNYIISYCKRTKMYNISLQAWGGEPLLCFDKIILIKKCFNNSGINAKISVETNGTLINLKVAKAIHENDINIGISLDGYKDIHNYQRTYIDNKPSFSDIIKGIKNLNNIGHSFGILSVITNYSADVVEEILDFFAKELRCKTVRFNMIHPSENDVFNMAFDINKAENFSHKLVDKLVLLNEEGYNITESNVKSKLENLLINNMGGFCQAKGCQYGKYQVTFDSQGNIYPCELTQSPEDLLGNIEDGEDLSELIFNSNKRQSFFIKDQKDQCNECNFWCSCRGGCSSAVKYKKDKNTKIDEIQCSVNKYIYPKLIELILNKPRLIEKLINRKVNFI